MDVIVGHKNMDFDCVSSMVAAKKLHPSSRAFLQPTAEGNVLEFLNLYRDHFSLFPHKQYRDHQPIETIVVVDTNRRERLGPYGEALDGAKRVVVYDHHPPEKSDIQADEYHYDSVGALITLMVEKLRVNDLRPSSSEATLFLLGLHQETGGLQFGTTGERDYEAGRYLMSSGADLDVVQNFIRQPLTEQQLKLFNELIANIRHRTINNVPVTFAVAERDEYVPEISLLTHKLQDTENCNLLFVLVRMGDRIQLVVRNRYDQVDAGDIAEQFGGGGHPRAASATLSGITLSEAQKALEDILREHLRPQRTARQIMSHPVHSVRPDLTVEEAEDVMLRLGHHGMPITDEQNRLVGILTRGDIDKALQHDLMHAPVKGFMNPEVVTVGPDTSLQQIQSAMTENQIGRVPVVEDGTLMGIVTRSDLIYALHEDITPDELEDFRSTPARSGQPRPDNIEGLLKRVLDEKWVRRLRRWGRVCDEVGDSLFLVGGCVRDILMEETTRDFDLVAENDGLVFARRLAEEEDGTISAHEKFRTAVVSLPDGSEIDVATARTEYYSHPAALPEVEVQHASVYQDLGRRDFSINAMALDLGPDSFGNLLDLYGGRRDIQEGKIRILYRASFLEDPTRIFRAVRFATRFGFEIEEGTLFQLRQSLENRPFEPVSGDRIREELNQVFREENPRRVVKRLFELDVLPTLHPGLNPEPAEGEWFHTAREIIERYQPSQPNMVYYCLLMDPLPTEQAIELGRRLTFSRERLDVLRKYDRFPEIRGQLADAGSNSTVYHLLDPLLPREVLLARLVVEDPPLRRKIRLFLEVLSREKPLVSGEDLKNWGMSPGPEMGEVLEELFNHQLDAEVDSKQELREYFERHHGRKTG